MSHGVQEQVQILHVDDDPSITDLTGTFLEREEDRFTVETATNADEGLERINERPPDCVVSDYNMPAMDGLEFLQTVREEYPNLPFILYTGKGSEAVASDAISAGVTDYLQKGSGSEQYELLSNRIRNAVQARRETERADRQEKLMRLTEFAGDTGGFELHAETGEMLLTDGIHRLIDLPSHADLTLNEALDLYHPEDRDDIRQSIDRARQTGEQTHGTWRLQAQDGNERIIDVTFTPETTDNDTEVLRGAVSDITEQRERQQELKSERRFITQALDALDDLFYVIGTDGTLRRWNKRGLEITGYSESDLDNMPATELFPEDERDKVARAVETTLIDGEETLEAEILTSGGQRVPYEFSAARLTDETGDTTGLVGIGRDLTERRQRERRFRALVEESNDIMSIVDSNGRFQYQSPSLERILGHDPEETVGDSAWEYIHPDDRESVIEEFETWVSNPNQPGDVVEYRARDADESWQWMEAEGNNQFDNPAIKGYVITSRNITDRLERQQDLEQTRDLLSNMEALADAGAWEYNSEMEQLMITDGIRRLYGLDPDAGLTLEAALDAIHPDDRDRLADRLTTCLETGEPYDIDVRLTTPVGEQRWLTAQGERLSASEAGSVLRGYIREITDEKARERRLTELNHATQSLLTAETQQEIADIGVEAASDVLDLQANAIHLSEADDTRLVPVAQTDEVASLIGDAQPLPVADSIAGRVYREGEPEVIADVKQKQDVYDSETNLGGHLYLPLADYGVLIAGSEKRAAFDQQDLTLGELLAGTLVAAFDRVERKQFLQALANEIAELSIDFLRTKGRDLDTLINGTLEQIGTLVDADRTYVFDVDHETKTLSNTHEWCSEGIEPQIDNLQNLPQESLPWWTQKLKHFEKIIIPKVSEFPPEAEAEQRILQEQNVDSLIVTPMISNDELVGFIGFDWVEEQEAWSDEFINILRIVSELITTASERKEREQRIEELKNQYETLAENFPDGSVFLIDMNLECVRAGGDELSKVGLSSDVVRGTKPHDLFPEETANELCHYYEEALDGTANTFKQEYEGERYRIQTVPVRTDGEEIDHVMAVSQNVSERVEEKQELERQNERLEEFSSVVSHDLRNPLQVASGRLELIREEYESDHINEVAQALDRMEALIEDLLTLAREGKQVDETEPVGLANAAKNSWQMVNTEQAVLDTETSQVVEADRSQLQQLFENLYRNAVEHGGDDVTVSIGAMEDGFYVADTGSGILEADREEVFEAGYSTSEDGTGFGLRIVKQIADAHGWEITVTESKQDGTRFDITGVVFADH